MQKSRLWQAILIAGMLATLAFSAFFSSNSTAIDYATFQQRLRAGEIASVDFSDTVTLKAYDLSGNAFTFDNPRVDTFKHMLLLQGVQVRETGSGGYGALLMLALVAALLWRGRRRKETEMAVAVTAESETPTTTFADVAANEEALASLHDLVDFIREPDRYAGYGAQIPRGVLLYGPPGTGKTLMARALAGEAGVPFYAVNGADFVEMYVGVGASRVRKLFAKARKAGRAVVFVDEIDAIGKKRDNQSDEREQTLNALLSEMSGFHQGSGVIVVAATNRVDTLDEALLRAGRFDRQIEVPLPTYEERLRILQVHAKGKPFDEMVDWPSLATQTALFSGAKLESMLNEAAILAAKRHDGTITDADVRHAYEIQLCGMEKHIAGVAECERQLTAAHEAGHALTTFVLLPESRLRRVTIVPSTRGAAGYSMAVQPERLFHRKQELLHHIAVALAGRVAEELAFGPDAVSTGAANDLEKAAALARRMVCEWGMLPDSDAPYLFSQAAREAASQLWFRRGWELARNVLLRYQSGWTRLTSQLLQQESLDEAEITECFARENVCPLEVNFPCENFRENSFAGRV